jgi:hypothetical protein
VGDILRDALGLGRLVLVVFYAAGPLLIMAELLKPQLSIPIILLFAAWSAVSLTLSATTCRGGREFDSFGLTIGLVVLSLCVVWIYFSGIGSYAVCRWDYAKHNLLFTDLLAQYLPIETSFEGRRFILHYSFAFYIIPVRLQQGLASLGLGVGLNAVLLLTYSAVLFLAVWLLARGRAVTSLILLLVLILVGGLDILGMVVFNVEPDIVVSLPSLGIDIPKNIEWWGLPKAPQSLTMNLYYAPQHFFAALIGTALIFSFLKSSKPVALILIDALIVVAASSFWSPYVAIGLAVLTALKFVLDGGGHLLRRLRQEGWATLIKPVGMLSCAFALALILVGAAFVTAAVPLSPPQLLINPSNVPTWLLTYALNYAPFIVAFSLISWSAAWRGTSGGAVNEHGLLRDVSMPVAACLAASALILLFQHGVFNDWAMRTTLPLLIALSVILTQAMLAHLRGLYLAILLAVLAASTASSLSELAIGVFIKPNCSPYGTFTLRDMGALVSQYEGRPDSILYRYLARPH